MSDEMKIGGDCKHGVAPGYECPDCKQESELAAPAGSVRQTNLLLRCPDCQGDQWTETANVTGGYQCLVCWAVYKRHTIYTIGFLQGYDRGKREAQNNQYATGGRISEQK